MARIAVVGAGLAGHRTVTALRAEGFAGEIVVIGDEVHHPYDRPPLSKQLLSGAFTVDDVALPVTDLDVTWRLGSPAVGLDIPGRSVSLADGSSVGYDSVVIATGRRARPWTAERIPGGVWTLRSLEDTLAFRSAAVPGRRVVIIGAGFIGCEVAATLRSAGIESVTVVDVASQPMPVLGAEAGLRAAALHRRHGVDLRLGTGVDRIEGDERVTAVVLSGGESLPADVVLVAMGSLANTEWLAGSGLQLVNGAIACGDGCLAVDASGSAIDTVAVAGDVAAWRHPHADGSAVCIEHWSNARDMAAVAAATLVSSSAVPQPLRCLPTFWSDQYDVKIKSAGYLRAADRFTVVEEDPATSKLVIEAHRGDDLVGAIVFNANRAIIGYQRTLGSAALTSA